MPDYIAKPACFVNTFLLLLEENLSCSGVPQTFVGAGVVEARQQPFKLLWSDGNYFFPGSGPSEPMLLQTLMPDAKSVMIPVKDLDHVSPPIAEYKEVSRKWILFHDLLDHNGKTIDGLSHICIAHGQENTVGRDGKHHMAATSRIKYGRDVTGASASSSIVKSGVMTRTTGALWVLPFSSGSFKGTRVRPVRYQGAYANSTTGSVECCVVCNTRSGSGRFLPEPDLLFPKLSLLGYCLPW
jgi:hypothetical protein